MADSGIVVINSIIKVNRTILILILFLCFFTASHSTKTYTTLQLLSLILPTYKICYTAVYILTGGHNIVGTSMKSSEIRQRFFNYFIKHGHEKVASSSLIPAQDPTLLFTNAGMNQFKDLFLGLEKRSYTRATTIQKCVRAGGKHNDLDNVGFTRRHLTFFEMMGNFSFGDYFKKEAIRYAWDFLTHEVKLDGNALHASVFETDDEAYALWRDEIKLPVDR